MHRLEPERRIRRCCPVFGYHEHQNGRWLWSYPVYSGWCGVVWFRQVASDRWPQMDQWELQSQRWESHEVADVGPSWEQTLMAGLACSLAVGNEGSGRTAEELPQSD